MMHNISAQEVPTPQPQQPPSREQLRQQIQDAIQATREAVQAQQPSVAQPPPPFEFRRDEGPPENVIILVVVLASLAAATIIFGPLFRALGRRIERRGEGTPDTGQLHPRLDRIEQAIEAMAVEVERISEGQRYVAKQMHELRALPAPNPLAEPALAQRVPEAVRRGDPGT
ncbi:MAG TPA: hypothetical protein VJ717_02880 [Gemmatimonadaceae bacterium]|nr:hypothetical protein [Gemmatimonadaceae bacterium]